MISLQWLAVVADRTWEESGRKVGGKWEEEGGRKKDGGRRTEEEGAKVGVGELGSWGRSRSLYCMCT